MLKAGVPCSISTDDPSVFESDMGREVRIARREIGISWWAMRRCRAAAIDAAFVDEREKRRLRREILGPTVGDDPMRWVGAVGMSVFALMVVGRYLRWR